jgi:hypothetical protein
MEVCYNGVKASILVLISSFFLDILQDASIANKGEAEKCRDMAKGYMSKGEYAKAARFFDKSLRLFPLPGMRAIIFLLFQVNFSS